MNFDTDRIAELADRQVTALTRRDVALALLAIPAAEALDSLPGIRRGMLAAGNPLSAPFWNSAERVLRLIDDGAATVGDVRTWLEATGTEPAGIIGLHVWDEASQRSQLAEEMHVRLVNHLEERLADGQIDPDLLVAGDAAARHGYIETQERWMTSPLSDGRVPMDVLLDEKDEELFAEWDAADAEALGALEELLAGLPGRPLPSAELRAAAGRMRELLAAAEWPAAILVECGGLDVKNLPADDQELWLTVAAGIASPVGTEETWPIGSVDDDTSEEMPEADAIVATLCAIDHYDWLAVTSALVTGGPGTAASSADLAGYVRDYDPDADVDDELDELELDDEELDEEFEDDDELEDDEEFDELGMEDLFEPVVTLWREIGILDEDDQLTALGWWGLPEAMRQVWTPAED